MHKHFLWISKCPGKKRERHKIRKKSFDKNGTRKGTGGRHLHIQSYCHCLLWKVLYRPWEWNLHTHTPISCFQEFYRLSCNQSLDCNCHICNQSFPHQERNSGRWFPRKWHLGWSLSHKISNSLFFLPSYLSPEQLWLSKIRYNSLITFIVYPPHPYANSHQGCSFTFFPSALLLVEKNAKKEKWMGSYICSVSLTFQSNVSSQMSSVKNRYHESLLFCWSSKKAGGWWRRMESYSRSFA